MKYTPRTKPFKHQARATLKAVRKRNLAVFFEPRLGKSKVACDWAGILALKGEVQRVVVFAPSIALDVWRTQLHLHFPFSYEVEDFDYSYPPVVRDDNPTRVKFFLAGREETFRAERASTNLKRPKQREIERWNPDAIVLDESHQYKRPGSRGAQDAWRLVRRLRKRRGDRRPYVIELSGTPNPKGWRDLFAQFRIMDDSLLGTSASDFDEEYVVRGVGRRKWQIVKYRHLPRLKRIIRENSITCTAEQAGLAGKLFWQVLPVTLPQKVKDIYEELAEEYIVQTDHGTIDAANQGVLRLRLLQVASGFVGSSAAGPDTPLHSEKVEAVRAYAKNLGEQGESLVVYCRFTAEVDAYFEALSRAGFSSAMVDGRVRKRDRAEAIRKFQAGDLDALVFQYQAGNVSIELTAAAEVLFTTLPDGWVDFWQCLNRLRGPNQHRPVRVSAILAKGTVDRRVLESLRRKEDWHGELMRDKHRFLRGL